MLQRQRCNFFFEQRMRTIRKPISYTICIASNKNACSKYKGAMRTKQTQYKRCSTHVAIMKIGDLPTRLHNHIYDGYTPYIKTHPNLSLALPVTNHKLFHISVIHSFVYIFGLLYFSFFFRSFICWAVALIVLFFVFARWKVFKTKINNK